MALQIQVHSEFPSLLLDVSNVVVKFVAVVCCQRCLATANGSATTTSRLAVCEF